MGRRSGVLAVALAAVILTVIPSASLTDASFVVTRSSSSAMTTGQVNAVTALGCPASGSGVSGIPFTWTQPVTTGNGLVPTSYTLAWSGTAGSGTKSVSVLTAMISGLDVSRSGSITVTVYANVGVWQSTASTVSRAVTMSLNVAGLILTYSCA